MTKLSVNLNKVALLRNTRNLRASVTRAAKNLYRSRCSRSRFIPSDQSVILTLDVYTLAKMMTVEFNIEKPVSATIHGDGSTGQANAMHSPVPDDPYLHLDRGWDLAEGGQRLMPIIDELRTRIRVSLFMDPEPGQIQRAKEVGAERIELYTEPHAAAFDNSDVETIFQQYALLLKRLKLWFSECCMI